MNKKITSFALVIVMIFSMCNISFANSNVERDTTTILYPGEFDGDKTMLFAENFDEPVNSLWASKGGDKFSVLTENGMDGAYGHTVGGRILFELPVGDPVNSGKFVMEFDYRSANDKKNNKYIYLDNGRTVSFARIHMYEDIVEIENTNKKISGITPDEWHHIKWCMNFDTNTQTLFVDDDEGVSFVLNKDKDIDLRRITIRTESGNQYLDIDNVQVYMVDEKPVYSVNKINYSTSKAYPTANAVVEGVNITKNRDKTVDTSLMVALYDEKGVMQAVSVQTIQNTDFNQGTAKDIALEKAITLPEDFNSAWQVCTFIWDDAAYIPLEEKYEGEYNVELTSLTPRQVFQRNAENIGKVKLAGNINADNIVSLEASATKAIDAKKGADVAWTEIPYDEETNKFDTTLDVPAGGWYTINVRAKFADGGIAEDAVEKVGVGEVFITTGQSNSVNSGGELGSGNFRLTRAEYDTISMYDLRDGEWARARDPLFNASSNQKLSNSGTTPWCTMANELSEKLSVPIAIVSLGLGSQAVSSWDPDKSNGMYPNTIKAVNVFGKDGIRAILFHQGEQDVRFGTGKDKYQETFEKMLNRLREEAGWDVPWVIAQVGYNTTFNDGVNPTESAMAIKAAQRAICEENTNCYIGPDTDVLGGNGTEDGMSIGGVYAYAKDADGNYYRNNGTDVHFSYQGSVAHGKLWVSSLIDAFFDPYETDYIDIPEEEKTIVYTEAYTGDKKILHAETFDNVVDDMWKKENKLTIKTEDGTDGSGAYGYLTGDVAFYDKGLGVIKDGVLIVEFDYKAPKGANNRFMIDNERYYNIGELYLQKNDDVTIGGQQIKNVAADTWHHIKWVVDVDNKIQKVFLDGKEGISFGFEKDPDLDLRHVKLRTNGNKGLALDNVIYYTIDKTPAYNINNINYSTEKAYPTAGAVVESVNVLKNKDKYVKADLVVEVYDENGVLKASAKQAIKNTKFDKEVDKDVDLEEAITLPAEFEADWKVRSYIISNEGEVMLSNDYNNGYNVEIQSPAVREVFQRDASDMGKVNLTGVINADNVQSLEANAVVDADAKKGVSVDWTAIAYDTDTNVFDATLDVPAGGWYTINVRATLANGKVVESAVEKVGVGEVFLMTGQSNSAAHGGDKKIDNGQAFNLTRAEYDTISMYDIRDGGTWAKARDPLFNPHTNKVLGVTGSTPWCTMANGLTEELEVPIALVSLGQGSQSISSFSKGNTNYNNLLIALKKFGVNGVRAVLFHQGEANIGGKTPQAEYVATFEQLLKDIREEAGWNVPWVIAQVGYHTVDSVVEFGPQVKAAQREVCEKDPYCFLGPETDLLGGVVKLENGDLLYPDAKELDENGNRYRGGTTEKPDVHFSYDGVQAHGRMWIKPIMDAFFTSAE